MSTGYTKTATTKQHYLQSKKQTYICPCITKIVSLDLYLIHAESHPRSYTYTFILPKYRVLKRHCNDCNGGRTGAAWECSFLVLELTVSLKSTHKGVNQRSKYVTQIQQQRPELPTVTLTWHACEYKVQKLHQRYISTYGNSHLA